jgi:hypothetical protein
MKADDDDGRQLMFRIDASQRMEFGNFPLQACANRRRRRVP